MSFLTLVAQNLMRRKYRTALSSLGVAVGLGTVIALLSIAGGMEKSFSAMYNQRGVDIVVVDSGIADQISSRIDEQVGDEILAYPEVKNVAAYLYDMLSFDDEDVIGVMIFGRDPRQFMFSDITMLQGKSLEPDCRNEAILGKVLAKNLSRNVGDEVLLEGEKFVVRGIFESKNVFENGAVILPLKDMQRVAYRPDDVTGFCLVLHDEFDNESTVAEVCARIEAIVDEQGESLQLSALGTDDFAATRLQTRAVHAVAWAVSTVAIVSCILMILNTMSLSVFERAREIGILRALGWQRRRVFQMVFCESLLLLIIGSIVGTLIGFLLTIMLSNFRHTAGYISGEIHLLLLVKAWLLTFGIGTVGGMYPALYATRLLPTEAVRHE